ncbi:hypothetical protein ACJMK2_033918 [Sinanodonta woodiana]|uniref:Polycomb protein VEFS-Box domain-containing protein n=1 Tax=Sinanodonta woodiana TaxID=1069815 RepID=A0ABD3WRE4_SINWO
MRSKKREREQKIEEGEENESIEADRESFLQAFEKPTQIYRYLRTRHLASPLYLQRNLSFMKHRQSVTNAKRKTFKVESILKIAEAKRKEPVSGRPHLQCMNLVFSGFFNEQVPLDTNEVEVEAILMKICHKKRKDASSPVIQTSLGKVRVTVNPSSDFDCSEITSSSLNVSPEAFTQNNGHSVKSYVLHLSVTCHLRHSIPNGICNGDLMDPEEPHPKRRKNGRTSVSLDDRDDLIVYGSELVVYDRRKCCQLTEGDYQLVLQELGSKSPPKKQGTWETVLNGKAVGPFEVFNRCPTLKFSLSWKDVSSSSSTTAGSEVLNAYSEFNNAQYSYQPHFDNFSGYLSVPSINGLRAENQTTPRKKTQVVYQFLYSNNMRQQTDAREDMCCPWCSINCDSLYSLLKHLRLSHARFNFLYVPHSKGAKIDVSINERYDGSYVGNPQDLNSHIGYAFSRKGPVRRTPVTHVIVYRPVRMTPSLSEFLELETDNQYNRQLVQGHNRLYYHTATTLPLKPQEIDFDSEDESYPPWLKQKTTNMIDEFTDVNEGEKELMKLWNLHIMKHGHIADCQIPSACNTFVEEHGHYLIEKNLCRNFLLHMMNLFDFSLIKPEVVHRAVWQLEMLKEEMGLE